MDGGAKPTDWTQLQGGLRRAMPSFLLHQRWFGGKTRVIQSVETVDCIPIVFRDRSACIFLQRVDYADGIPETYVVPLLERRALNHRPEEAGSAPPTLQVRTEEGEEHILCDALWDRAFQQALLEVLASGTCFRGVHGELVGTASSSLPAMLHAAEGRLEPSLLTAEQSNSSILYGRSVILKFIRRIEQGINPDFEVSMFLSQHAGFEHIPPAAGVFEYRHAPSHPATVGILQGFVPNQGDAWKQSLKALSAYYDLVEVPKGQLLSASQREGWRHGLFSDMQAQPSKLELELVGDYREWVRLLGQRTAELHVALASDHSDPEFAPVPFSLEYQQVLYDSMTGQVKEALGLLRGAVAGLPAELQGQTHAVLSSEDRLVALFQPLREKSLTGLRTRIHGDFHLGQVLFTGDDFVFIDFEGEPARSLDERRAKHSPLRDVAGMLRSFHYAAFAALFQRLGDSLQEDRRLARLFPFAKAWYAWVSTEYMRGYLAKTAEAEFLPRQRQEAAYLLNLLLLEKAVYELKYELNHRLGWVAIPLAGIRDLIESAG